MCWGTCVIEELQDVDSAGKETSEEERMEVLSIIRKAKAEATKNSPNQNQASTPTWRKKIPGGHRLKFVLDSSCQGTQSLA